MKAKVSQNHQSVLPELQKVVKWLQAQAMVRKIVPGPIDGRRGAGSQIPRLKLSDEGSHHKLIASGAGVQIVRVYYVAKPELSLLQSDLQRVWKGEVVVREK